MRIFYERAIENLNLLANLSPFDPIIIGTPPLEIDVTGSDIDIACYCEDLVQFTDFATSQFQSQESFQLRHAIFQNQESVIVQFIAFGWDIEIFCQSTPTNKQWGVRHFRIEQRLLALSPKLKSIVIDLKRSGLKTEPAFAKALGLSSDPYPAILGLETYEDYELSALIAGKSNRGITQ